MSGIKKYLQKSGYRKFKTLILKHQNSLRIINTVKKGG